MSFEMRSKPMAVRFQRGKRSQHFQITVPVEVRKRFDITSDNADYKKLVFVIRGTGTVEVECVEAAQQQSGYPETPERIGSD
jgi:hypothetical protein